MGNPEREHKWSKAAEAVLETQDILKESVKDFSWSATWNQTSDNIADRWKSIKFWCENIQKPCKEYSPALLESLEQALEKSLSYIDLANIKYDPHYYINQVIPCEDELYGYAEIIIEAIKKEITEEELYILENQEF